MEREQRSDRFTAIEDQYAGYEVYDRNGQKIGKVDDLFVDENDRAEYIGVKMGFLGLEGTNLILWELARVDEEGRHIEVSVDRATTKGGPFFNDDEDITPEYEKRVPATMGWVLCKAPLIGVPTATTTPMRSAKARWGPA